MGPNYVPINVTGTYERLSSSTTVGRCPPACSTSCVNGCLMCADGTYLSIFSSSCTQYTAGLTPGSLIQLGGVAQWYNYTSYTASGSITPSINEYQDCTSFQLITPAPAAPPPPPYSVSSQCGSVPILSVTTTGGAVSYNLTGVYKEMEARCYRAHWDSHRRSLTLILACAFPPTAVHHLHGRVELLHLRLRVPRLC